MVYTLRFFSLQICLFHNSNVFGSCIIHIFYIYSTNIGTEYFKHCVYSPFFFLQNAICFIIRTYLVPVLFTFYMQCVLKLKKNNSGAKRLMYIYRKAMFAFASRHGRVLFSCYYVISVCHIITEYEIYCRSERTVLCADTYVS